MRTGFKQCTNRINKKYNKHANTAITEMQQKQHEMNKIFVKVHDKYIYLVYLHECASICYVSASIRFYLNAMLTA